nr:AraC family transcriptional regulator [Bacteroidaceae bacterium]
WTAAFFASLVLGHLWWMYMFFEQNDSNFFYKTLIIGALDILTSLPTMVGTMVYMLQDRRRPIWPVAILVAMSLSCLVSAYFLGSRMSFIILLQTIIITLCIAIFMVHALRQYGRWLRENYADLEHKEVWQTFIVIAAFMMSVISYNFANDFFIFDIILEVSDIILICILVWRVETLQTLEEPAAETVEPTENVTVTMAPVYNKIESLLQHHCVEGQYYLRHDLSLSHLAKLIGTNRTYLSNYFAQQGTTYNAYINGLRIEHFMRLYQKSVRANQVITAGELAYKCGYKSYTTFTVSFKQLKGLTVAAWMRETSLQSQKMG